MTVVLMYHALHEGDPGTTIDAEDRPYAVSRAAFAAQLDRIVARRDAGEGRGDDAVMITFDDGHASNHDIALPMLLERGLSATFFITTGFTGAREHFCDRAQLAALAAAGMTLGGHGHTHAFFDDLDDDAAREELERCRAVLSPIVPGDVNSFSFPGGRQTARSRQLARAAGFSELHGSALGIAPRTGSGCDIDEVLLPRVPVRAGTDLATFDRMIGPDSRWYASVARRQRLKHVVRRALGNRLYHGLYTTFSAR